MKCSKQKNYLEHTAVEEGHNGGFQKGYDDDNVEFFPKCCYCCLIQWLQPLLFLPNLLPYLANSLFTNNTDERKKSSTHF